MNKKKANDSPTGDAGAPEDSNIPEAEKGQRDHRLRQNLPPPLCPYHKCECKCNRSDPLFTRYYCPEKGCTYSAKVARPQMDQILARREQEEGFSAR